MNFSEKKPNLQQKTRKRLSIIKSLMNLNTLYVEISIHLEYKHKNLK